MTQSPEDYPAHEWISDKLRRIDSLKSISINAEQWIDVVDEFQTLRNDNTALRAVMGELVSLAEYFLGYLENNDFANGVTDPTGSVDEGLVYQARDIARVKQALSRANQSEGK